MDTPNDTSSDNFQAQNKEVPNLEHLWEFAGQKIDSSHFTNAMIHFYRGEMSRANTWRVRLDTTTNWAVITTGAALTIAFSNEAMPPSVLFVHAFLILMFLIIEARRYRYFELWAYRVRLMEINFFAGLLSPPFVPHSGWADQIGASLREPKFTIGLMEALGRRYRRTYAPLFIILMLSWLVLLFIRPEPVTTLAQFINRATLGPVSGGLLLSAGIIFNLALIIMGLFTLGLQQSQGEVLTHEPVRLLQLGSRLKEAASDAFDLEIPTALHLEPRKRLVYIISDKAQALSTALIDKLERGVTLLDAKGMYTGRAHSVLLCAIEARQLNSLRAIVNQLDPHAFVIVMPVQDIHGAGFRPL